MPHHSPDDADIGAGANPQVMVCVRSGTGIARIDDNDRCIVFFLGLEDVLQRDRMRFGRVGADQQDRSGIVDVVVRVGHRTVTPGIGDAGNRGGMANARLVVDIVGAPHRRHLAEQIGLLIVELGRAQPEHRIGTGFFPDIEQLVADIVNRFVPRNLLPLAVDQLGGILQTAFAMPVFADRSALGAVRAAVEWMVKSRLLPCPDAVLNFRDDAAAHRAVGANGLGRFDLAAAGGRGRGLLHHHR